jgi:hypothetical protein
MKNRKVARRTFLRTTVAAGAAVPLAGIPIVTLAQAKVAEDDPAAAALGYKHDAGSVDAAKFPQKTDDQNCANCRLYSAAGEEGWGNCGIFPGKLVNAKGWCSAWVTAG